MRCEREWSGGARVAGRGRTLYREVTAEPLPLPCDPGSYERAAPNAGLVEDAQRPGLPATGGGVTPRRTLESHQTRHVM